MRKIIICTFLTLDGVMQKPSSDDEVGAAIAGWHESCDAMLLGRKTYEIFASHWPTADPDNPVEWQNSTPLKGDVVDAVRELKASDGRDINVVGSGDLAQSLMRHGLVDEYRLTVHPVIIATGRRLFSDGAIPTALEPVSVSTPRGAPSSASTGRTVPSASGPRVAPGGGGRTW